MQYKQYGQPYFCACTNHNAFITHSDADQMQNVTIQSDESPQSWKHC